MMRATSTSENVHRPAESRSSNHLQVASCRRFSQMANARGGDIDHDATPLTFSKVRSPPRPSMPSSNS